MWHRKVEIQKQDFRKLSAIFQDLADQNTNLKLSPTKSEAYAILEVDDYGMKHAEFINLIFWGKEKGMQPYHLLRLHPSFTRNPPNYNSLALYI